ncbi:hypothetical protein [Rickettsia endosymbiont of Halotydeus destructor]|uniref:hypothetical protein n=1 Tax=Rickettsia endosymbiont of Halotydeus destructor TaxID=2996754 RepID=UPI003BAE9E3E
MFSWSQACNKKLIEAIEERKEIEAEKLIANMSDHAINFIDKDNKTVLTYAASKGLEKICELLINKMSDHAINYTLAESSGELENFIQKKISHNIVSHSENEPWGIDMLGQND